MSPETITIQYIVVAGNIDHGSYATPSTFFLRVQSSTPKSVSRSHKRVPTSCWGMFEECDEAYDSLDPFGV